MIEGTSGAGAAATTASVGQTSALTPEALMLYCGARLRDLDQEVNETFARQKQYRDATSALNDLQSDLNGLIKTKSAEGEYAIPEHDQATLDRIGQKFERAITAAPPGIREKLETAYAEWKTNPGNTAYNVKEVKAKAEEIGGLAKEISSAAELDMIGLQSLMSQRQTAIQLTTNLLSSFNESLKAIAAKVGS
jgi:hypothetical protein